jgi:hypothetical protein
MRVDPEDRHAADLERLLVPVLSGALSGGAPSPR